MIATHTSPDWDAITACWLLQRYDGWTHEVVAFVNTGSPDTALLASATAVVDTGREYDPSRLRFDHHQFPGKQASATCAAEQVYQYLNEDGSLGYLASLIALVTAGDNGSPAANESRNVGMHLELSALKMRKTDDQALLAWGYNKLDLLAEGLKARREAAASLAAHTIYTSADGLLIALDNAPQGATGAAYEQGVRVVVWANNQTVRTHGVGVNRSSEWSSIDVGEIVRFVIDYSLKPHVSRSDLASELATWFCHPAGFFAGRGTAKAPRPDPVTVPLLDIARAIDAAWWR